MISLDLGTHQFQLRAAAVFAFGDAILLHRLEGDAFWALPGGRVEPGEDAARTVVREMHEELGQQVRCGELLFVVENFFDDRGRHHHEIGLYFNATFLPDSSMLDTTRSHLGVEGRRALEFKWFARRELADLDVRPSFLRRALAGAPPRLQHIVQRG